MLRLSTIIESGLEVGLKTPPPLLPYQRMTLATPPATYPFSSDLSKVSYLCVNALYQSRGRRKRKQSEGKLEATNLRVEQYALIGNFQLIVNRFRIIYVVGLTKTSSLQLADNATLTGGRYHRHT